jgi:hypothetical protein
MTLTEVLAAIGKLRADAERLEHALHQHVADERDPVRHGALFRLHGVLRDFCLAMPAAK